MLEQVENHIYEACKLIPSQALVVGVSGGPDSLFLLVMLCQAGFKPVVAHLNHSLRPEAAQEAEAVARLANELGLQCRIEKEDVAAFARQNRLSVEEAARCLRYRFLFQQADLDVAQAVAVGHTADDQVETILMHLLRGSGLSGLKGMPYRSLPNSWSHTIPLVRPLLCVWREEILEYLKSYGYQPVFDTSNTDLRYYRNRLRNELIPYLEQIHPGLRKRLWKTAAILAEEHALLGELYQAAWGTCFLESHDGCLAFSAKSLSVQPVAVQRELLRRAIFHLLPEPRDIDYDTIERGRHFLRAGSRSHQCELADGIFLKKEDDRLWLILGQVDLPSRGWPQISSDSRFTIEIPGELELNDGWHLCVEMMPCSESILRTAQHNTDAYTAWFDADRAGASLLVRTRQPGDRFQPLGMDGKPVRLSDFMVNNHLAQRARDSWPLLCSPCQIIWVPGFRIAHPVRLTQETRQAIKAQLLK